MRAIMADMTSSEESRLGWAERVYGLAADHFTDPQLAFWDLYGEETVRRAHIAAGNRVLDLCCGAGASVVPAARAVGPDGSVTGVDITAPLLAQARERLEAEGLHNVELVRGDATATGFDGGSFDAVVCVFGVFFVDDMAGFVREMWRMVRPGGHLAITTWGPDLFEPLNSLFWNGVRDLRSELYRDSNPWDQMTTPELLASLLSEGGVEGPEVVAVPGSQALATPEDFWNVVLGSGYRATLDSLDDDQQQQLHEAILDGVRRSHATEIRTDVVIAVAAKPSP
jgi:SAM-dependent methyltransferase